MSRHIMEYIDTDVLECFEGIELKGVIDKVITIVDELGLSKTVFTADEGYREVSVTLGDYPDSDKILFDKLSNTPYDPTVDIALFWSEYEYTVAIDKFYKTKKE